MPRRARLDAPGTLHHVIIRGIEKRRIVDDRWDRHNFVSRLVLKRDILKKLRKSINELIIVENGRGHSMILPFSPSHKPKFVVFRYLHNKRERITPTIVESTVLQNLHSELVLAEIEFSKLQKTYSWKHPNNLLLTKFKETNIIEDMNITNMRLVEPAVTPEIPIKPKKKLNLILGIIMGLMSGVGFAFFLQYLDRTIKTPDEVAQYLDLPILAAIPKVSK